MSVESKVFDQLNKVELGSQRIELGVIDDAVKGINQVKKAYANPIWNQLEKLPNMVLQIVSEAQMVLKDAAKGQAMAIESARKASTMAKELGIANPVVIDEIFKNNDYDDLLEAFSKDVDKIISNAKKA